MCGTESARWLTGVHHSNLRTVANAGVSTSRARALTCYSVLAYSCALLYYHVVVPSSFRAVTVKHILESIKTKVDGISSVTADQSPFVLQRHWGLESLCSVTSLHTKIVGGLASWQTYAISSLKTLRTEVVVCCNGNGDWSCEKALSKGWILVRHL